MELLFKNITQYSEAIYNTFLNFHKSKYRFSYIAYNVITIALILLCLILQLAYHYYSIAIFSCLLLSIFILWRYLHPISKISQEYNSTKIQNEVSFTFKFYKNHFTCEDTKNISKIKYSKLYRVFETDNFFYLYINRNYAFLVDKTYFKKETCRKFSIFMKKKCPLRFRNCTTFTKKKN